MSDSTTHRKDRLPPDWPLTRGDLLRRCGSAGETVVGLGTWPAVPVEPVVTFSTDAQRYEIYEHPASTSRDYVVLFSRHYDREGAVLRGRGTLQECRRIAELALPREVRDREGFEEIVAEPIVTRSPTRWDIVWGDDGMMRADASDHPELCEVAGRLYDAASDSIEQLAAAGVRADPRPNALNHERALGRLVEEILRTLNALFVDGPMTDDELRAAESAPQ